MKQSTIPIKMKHELLQTHSQRLQSHTSELLFEKQTPFKALECLNVSVHGTEAKMVLN